MRLPLHRSAAVSLALAAMLLRALLPDGWMPVAGPSPFTICTVDANHHDGKAPADQEHSHAPCAFAAAAPLAPPTIATFAFGTWASASRVESLFSNASSARAPPHRPNAARAPPAFA